MPPKLTKTEYKIIAVGILVSALSLVIGVKYFWRAFPEASIEFRVNRDDSTPVALKFLAERNLSVAGYRHAAVFDYDDSAKVYLERTQGLVKMNGLTRGPVHLWRWSHRWFKPQQKEEIRVDVSPAGQLVGFVHDIDESAPGANLESAAARSLAEGFLARVVHRNLADLEFVESESEKRPARTDYSFTWKQKSVDLGDGSLRVEVEVNGDQVGGYREFVKIPEQWSRDYERLRSRNNAAQLVDQVFWLLLIAAAAIILISRLRDRDVPIRLSIAFGSVGAVLYFLGKLNTFSLEAFEYKTTDSYSSFMAGYIGLSALGAFGVGAAILFLVASGEPVYSESYPAHISLRRYFSWEGLRTRSFFMANVVGLTLTFFFFAYQTLFYLLADHFGAWAPADIPFTDLLNTRFPWVTVLFIGFLPAVTEELQFRAFAIPFLRKLFRSSVLAVVLAAFIWGFLHSAYPNQPFFIRGIEVGLGGILIGFVMLRFGILATLIWHYSVDAIYTAFLLLRSPNHYLMISGAVAAGLMLVPFVVALASYLRSGTFTPEDALTNESAGVSRQPRKMEIAEPEAAIAYQPLARPWVIAACVLVVVFVVVAFIPVYRFGNGIDLRVTRTQAIHAADEFLSQQGVDTSRFIRGAWIHENLDPMAVRYLLERRSIKETDQIYRKATRPVLWQVRYFQPLEKDEYRVFVDVDDGAVFASRHILDEAAPGASLTPDAAQALAERYLKQRGYDLSGFELQDLQSQNRKAREDYTLVWQAKPDDPRTVGDARFRLQVDIAGDQVVGLSRYFKIPEQWVRERTAVRLPNVILYGITLLLALGLVAGTLILLVRQIRSGQVPWRLSAAIGATVAGLTALSELNLYPVFARQYDTSIPLPTFYLYVVVVNVIAWPLLTGLVAWLLSGLAFSLYPQAQGALRPSARRKWRRDAFLAVVLSLAAAAGWNRLSALLDARFHALAPVRVDLAPVGLDSAWPGFGFFTRAFATTLLAASVLAVLVSIIRWCVCKRAWWLWAGGLLVLVALGPAGAHSLAEYGVGWAEHLVLLGGLVALAVLFLRGNLLAYLAAIFCLNVAEPVVRLLSQPAGFYRWNGVALGLLCAALLLWAFLPGRATDVQS